MPTVLVVDDEAAVRSALRKIFERAGLQVREAASGRSALEIIAGAPEIAAVVSDFVMPEIDGLALYDELVAFKKARRVVFRLLLMLVIGVVVPFAVSSGPRSIPSVAFPPPNKKRHSRRSPGVPSRKRRRVVSPLDFTLVLPHQGPLSRVENSPINLPARTVGQAAFSETLAPLSGISG